MSPLASHALAVGFGIALGAGGMIALKNWGVRCMQVDTAREVWLARRRADRMADEALRALATARRMEAEAEDPPQYERAETVVLPIERARVGR